VNKQASDWVWDWGFFSWKSSFYPTWPRFLFIPV